MYQLRGHSVGGTEFRDKVNDADIEGNLLHQFETIMAFFGRNLKRVQVGDEFNTSGVLEIPYICLVEITVNALVHRSLSWNAPIRIFIFDDRVEIHSPGTLPNGLTVEDIMAGTSMPRNNFLFNNAIYLLPYTGAGSGIQRALDSGVNICFNNNEKLHELMITISRESNQEGNGGSNQDSNGGSNQDSNGGSNQDSNGGNGGTNLKHNVLSKRQKDVVNFCGIPRTAQEILNRIGVSNQTKNRQKYITPLLDMGVIELTIPEKINDKNQKYRKVQK